VVEHDAAVDDQSHKENDREKRGNFPNGWRDERK